MQEEGWSERHVRSVLRDLRKQDFSFAQGNILGSMCTAPHAVARWAHDLFLETNLGDPGHFPAAAQLEREVLQDITSLLHAPPTAGARYLTGGTEANMLALYMARQTGRRTVILPDSAHFSFEKGARLLGMKLRYIPTTESGHADPDAMERAISRSTALVIGVAGTTELGLIDPISDLSEVALRHELPLHVDAAFGGYILPFLERAGRRPRPFDFRLDGVTTLSLDPHKMGMAPIPGGVMIARDESAWQEVAVETPYVSTDRQATLMGTRPGAAVAACWAVHRHLGQAGYASLAETMLDNATFLAARLQAMGIALVAEPELNVVTFYADDPDGLSGRLQERGLRVNTVPRFGAIRIVVGPHITRRVLQQFLTVLEEVRS